MEDIEKSINLEKNYWKNVYKTLIKDYKLYLMLLPMLVIFISFRYLPMYELLASFKVNLTGVIKVSEQHYLGYNNFSTLLFGTYQEQFWQAFRNTFIISFYGLLFGFPVPIILALFFNEIKSNAYRSILQVLTYLPKFISTVIITTLVWMLLSSPKLGVGGESNSGIIAQFLEMIGLVSHEDAVSGLMYKAEYFRAIYIISGIWESAGYGSIVFFAAVIAISPTSYEAAQIDGAGKLAQMRYIVLPSILSTIIIMLIIRIGSLLSVGYEQIILLKTTYTNVTAQVMSTFALDLKNSNVNLATVPEMINNITSMLLVIGANMISKKASDTSLY